MAADLPPIWQERIVCSIAAGERFGVPAAVMLAVATQEGGQPGLVRSNANGTYDLGSMQLNTAWLASLARYGVPARAALATGCYSYQLAAWRIRNHILRDHGDYWTRVANYHSHTPAFNAPYRAQIMVAARRWNAWLAQYRIKPATFVQSRPAPSPAPAAYRMTSGFGLRVHPITHAISGHAGLDIAAAYGTPVNSSADGVVTHAGASGGYGLMVEVASANGIATRYAHLSRISVLPGTQVTRGTTIGNVGSTGFSTGPHLHYEVRFRGVPINPLGLAH